MKIELKIKHLRVVLCGSPTFGSRWSRGRWRATCLHWGIVQGWPHSRMRSWRERSCWTGRSHPKQLMRRCVASMSAAPAACSWSNASAADVAHATPTASRPVLGPWNNWRVHILLFSFNFYLSLNLRNNYNYYYFIIILFTCISILFIIICILYIYLLFNLFLYIL